MPGEAAPRAETRLALPGRPGRLSAGREDGFALLIVLWALVVVAVIAGGIGGAGRGETNLARNLRAAAKVETAADGAIHEAIYHLLAPGEARWATSGAHRADEGGIRVDVRLESLAGRVNPNTATPELLREVLSAVGVEPRQAMALADAIALWREGRAGARTGVPSRAPGIGSIGDLLAVPGMTPAILARLKPHLTLWWEDDPDPWSSDAVVRTAMRALGDTRPQTPRAEPSRRSVRIEARATGAGAAFTRHADVVLDDASPARPWRIVAWDVEVD